MQETSRDNHPYFMYDHIHQQPQIIKSIIQQQSLEQDLNELSNKIHNEDLNIHLVGIGTSWHMSLTGSYFLQKIGCQSYQKVKSWHSMEFIEESIENDDNFISSQDIVIIITHRGTKHYSLQALQYAKEKKAVTVLITGQENNVKPGDANYIFRTSPQEKSSAHTMSATGSMTILFLLSISLSKLRKNNFIQFNDENFINLLQKTIDQCELQLTNSLQIMKNCNEFFFVGSKPHTFTALEISLKLKETCYVKSEGFQLEQFLHGPFCGINENSTLVTFYMVPPYSSSSLQNRQVNEPIVNNKEEDKEDKKLEMIEERMKQIIKASRVAGAKICIITQECDKNLNWYKEEIGIDNLILLIIPNMDEIYTSFSYLIVSQLFTYFLTLELKCNPDVFRLDNLNHKNAQQYYKL
ncbi:hypothetical protein ABK040_007402 [Willaertia magna]